MFKVGDKVKCISNPQPGYWFGEVGEIYTIKELRDKFFGKQWFFIVEDVRELSVSEERFELVKVSEKPDDKRDTGWGL